MQELVGILFGCSETSKAIQFEMDEIRRNEK